MDFLIDDKHRGSARVAIFHRIGVAVGCAIAIKNQCDLVVPVGPILRSDDFVHDRGKVGGLLRQSRIPARPGRDGPGNRGTRARSCADVEIVVAQTARVEDLAPDRHRRWRAAGVLGCKLHIGAINAPPLGESTVFELDRNDLLAPVVVEFEVAAAFVCLSGCRRGSVPLLAVGVGDEGRNFGLCRRRDQCDQRGTENQSVEVGTKCLESIGIHGSSSKIVFRFQPSGCAEAGYSKFSSRLLLLAAFLDYALSTASEGFFVARSAGEHPATVYPPAPVDNSDRGSPTWYTCFYLMGLLSGVPDISQQALQLRCEDRKSPSEQEQKASYSNRVVMICSM